MKINRTDIAESLLVFGIFTGLLIPIRLLFYDYLSHYWLGSFGVTSLVVFLIFYFSKKGKLGKIGKMMISKLEKRAKGKLGKFSIMLSMIFIYFWGLAIAGITYADPKMVTYEMSDLKSKGITDIKTLQAKTPEKLTQNQYLLSLLMLVTPNQLSFVSFKIINELSNGLVLSFGTIFLVDEIEILGLVIYFRYKKHSMILS